MGSINFIGSNTDDADAKQSQPFDFEYTDPEKDKAGRARIKPKTSFFKHHKKNSPTTNPADTPVAEAKFADKELVRKGKYKPTTATHKKLTADTQTTTTTPTYAPTRASHPSATQPSYTEAMEHTQQSSVAQPMIAPATHQPAARVGQDVAAQFGGSPTAPVVPVMSAPAPVQATPPAQLSQISPAIAPLLRPVVSSPAQVSPTSRVTQTAPGAPTTRITRVIPPPPPPPVQAAPMPIAGRSSTGTPAVMPVASSIAPQSTTQVTTQTIPQSIPQASMQTLMSGQTQKMYSTAQQARADTPISSGTAATQSQVNQGTAPQTLIPQPQQNLPELALSGPALHQIPTPPAPPIHQPVAVPVAPAAAPTIPTTPVPAAPNLSSQPVSQPAAAQHTARSRSNQPGVVHAQNVENLHGKKTDPEPITGKFLDINLLPVDFLKELSPTSKIVDLLKVALISCTILGVAYGIMVGYQSYFILQTKNNQLEINRLENEIRTYSTLQNQVNVTNDKLTAVNTLLGHHIYWSNVFTLLEQYTLPNVYYQSFSGNTSGLINLQAATTDFASISQQVHIFNQETEFIESASVSTASRSSIQAGTEETTKTSPSEIVLFNVNIHFNPDIFFYHTNATSNRNN